MIGGDVQAQSAAVESTGQAKAEAESRAQATMIECEAGVDQARLKAEALAIDTEAELQRLQQVERSDPTAFTHS